MNLYEVTNGYLGFTYTRSYVWAKDEEEARRLAEEAFKAQGQAHKYEPTYWTRLKVRRLFSADDAPFATEPSDEGWDGNE